jgi:hypothetical protein
MPVDERNLNFHKFVTAQWTDFKTVLNE